MEFLRTPDERFANLPGYAFTPHYDTVETRDGSTLRMHYLDEGRADGPVVLLLHGEPTWSYLYRSMISPLAAAGFRVLAPDLIGFGRSDKPITRAAYSYASNLDWLEQWFLKRDLRDVTLFCQDWGGLLGLRLVAAHPDLFARVLASNTALPDGSDLGDGFRQWRDFSQSRPDMEVGKVVARGVNRRLTPAEISAYDAPFPDVTYKAAVLTFPTLVPVGPDDCEAAENRQAWSSLEQFQKPFLTAFGDRDPVLGHMDTVLRERIPGAARQPHMRLESAGHFSQEDEAELFVHTLLKLMDD
jgi:haloalkane dehalogenase